MELWNGAAEGNAVVVKALLAAGGRGGQRAHRATSGGGETAAGARGTGGHGALRDEAGTADAGGLRREEGAAGRAVGEGVPAGGGAELLATAVRARLPQSARRRLARGRGRGLRALRRRAAGGARGQRPAARRRARQAGRHRALPPGLGGVLPRLGRHAQGVRAVPRAHQGQDGVGRQVRQAQRAGGRDFDSFGALERHLEEWMAEADARVHGTTHERPLRQVRARGEGRAAPAARRVRCRAASRGSSAKWPTTRSWTWTRCATACRTGWCARASRCRWASSRCASSTRGKLVATHARGKEPHARVVDQAHWEGLWRPRTVEPAEASSKLAVHGRSLEDYAAVVEQAERGAA